MQAAYRQQREATRKAEKRWLAVRKKLWKMQVHPPALCFGPCAHG